MDLDKLNQYRELAKDLTLNVNAGDLMAFANKLTYDRVIETEKRLKSKELPEEYRTRKEVSKLLNVSLVTLHHWHRKGILKSFKIGNQVRYRLSDITKALS